MSTTFDVFPSRDHVPTFRALLSVASAHLNAYLADHGVRREVTITVGLRTADEESRTLPTDLDGPCWWPTDQYAWFAVPGVLGGTDAYAEVMAPDAGGYDLGLSTLTEEIRGPRAEALRDVIDRALRVGRWWSFRRSAGQPAVVNVAYGLLAASLAELTDGIVHSIDSAWDHRLLPARPAEFLHRYFRPDRTEDPQWRDWVARCIGWLPDELTAG